MTNRTATLANAVHEHQEQADPTAEAEETEAILAEVRQRDAHLGSRLRDLIDRLQRRHGVSPDAGGTEYLSTGDAARLLGVSINTAKKWIRLGYIKGAFETPGGHLRIPSSEVERVRTLEVALSETSGLGSEELQNERRTGSPWQRT
jgi:excisionase family DNA binding protein